MSYIRRLFCLSADIYRDILGPNLFSMYMKGYVALLNQPPRKRYALHCKLIEPTGATEQVANAQLRQHAVKLRYNLGFVIKPLQMKKWLHLWHNILLPT